jgi:hypothetical protein
VRVGYRHHRPFDCVYLVGMGYPPLGKVVSIYLLPRLIRLSQKSMMGGVVMHTRAVLSSTHLITHLERRVK